MKSRRLPGIGIGVGLGWLCLTGGDGTPTRAVAAEAGRAGFEFREIDPRSLGLWEGDRPVFVYHHGLIRAPGVPADRARSSYIHPLYGLEGEVLTDDFPADHLHHRGLFWAWPHVGIDGVTHDLWMLKGVAHRFERWGVREANRGQARLEIENGWYVGERKVMAERVAILVQPATDLERVIDLAFVWTPVDRPIRLAGAEGKSYGGLTLRYAPGTNTVITTPLGSQSEDRYMTRLPWADLTRQWFAAGERGADGPRPTSGAAVFIGRDHPDYPPTWLTRHYGVLCVGWPGVDGREFAPGEAIRCRYRIWVHRGQPTAEQYGGAYDRYLKESSAR